MGKLAALVVLLLLLGSCSTLQSWKDYAEEQIKEKVVIVDQATEVAVRRWNGDAWVPAVETVPAGSYIVPPFPDLIGLRR